MRVGGDGGLRRDGGNVGVQEAERKWGKEKAEMGEQLRLALVKGEKGKQRLLAEVRRTGWGPVKGIFRLQGFGFWVWVRVWVRVCVELGAGRRPVAGD